MEFSHLRLHPGQILGSFGGMFPFILKNSFQPMDRLENSIHHICTSICQILATRLILWMLFFYPRTELLICIAYRCARILANEKPLLYEKNFSSAGWQQKWIFQNKWTASTFDHGLVEASTRNNLFKRTKVGSQDCSWVWKQCSDFTEHTK